MGRFSTSFQNTSRVGPHMALPGPGMGDLLNQVNCRTVQFSATPSGFARVCLQFLGDFCVDPEGESPETGEDVVLL